MKLDEITTVGTARAAIPRTRGRGLKALLKVIKKKTNPEKDDGFEMMPDNRSDSESDSTVGS